MTRWPVRRAATADIDALVRLWHGGWHRAHARFVPEALVALRSRDDFRQRLPPLLPLTRVTGPEGAPLGLCIRRGDEIYQLYLAEAACGTGIAAALLAEGEARIAASGHAVARLDCLAENARAVRFYRREGWRCVGARAATVDTAGGSYPLDLLGFEKRLAGG